MSDVKESDVILHEGCMLTAHGFPMVVPEQKTGFAPRAAIIPEARRPRHSEIRIKPSAEIRAIHVQKPEIPTPPYFSRRAEGGRWNLL